MYRWRISSEASRSSETSRETASQSSSVTASPLTHSSATRKTENRPAPALWTSSNRHPLWAAMARIASAVLSLNFIEQKSGPRPASFSASEAYVFYQKREAGSNAYPGAPGNVRLPFLIGFRAKDGPKAKSAGAGEC